MPKGKKAIIQRINKKQGGLWFEYQGEKFFIESPFAISFLEYLITPLSRTKKSKKK